jgi:hypothetical protein
VVCEADDHAVTQGTGCGVLDRAASLLIDDLKNAFEGNVCRLILRPSGQGLSHRIEKSDAAFRVGRNHCIANAGEGDT